MRALRQVRDGASALLFQLSDGLLVLELERDPQSVGQIDPRHSQVVRLRVLTAPWCVTPLKPATQRLVHHLLEWLVALMCELPQRISDILIECCRDACHARIIGSRLGGARAVGASGAR